MAYLKDRWRGWVVGCALLLQLLDVSALQVTAPLSSQSPPVAVAGVAYNWTIGSNTFDVPLANLTLSAEGLPSWMTFNAVSAAFAGTPDTAAPDATTKVSVSAAESGQAPAVDSFTLFTVSTNTSLPTIQISLASQLSNSSLGPYCVLHASGPYHGMLRVPPGYSFSVTFQQNSFGSAGGGQIYYNAHQQGLATLPTWLSFDNTSLTISGTVPASFAQDGQQIFPIDIGASLVPGASEITDTFYILVALHQLDLPNPLMPGPTVVATEAFSYKIPLAGLELDAVNATMADVHNISIVVPPSAPWISYNSSTYTIYGTPPYANASNANLSIPVTFTDIYNDTATGNLTLSIIPSTLFNSTTLPDLNVTPGQNYSLSLLPFLNSKNLSVPVNVTTIPASSGSWVTYNPSNDSISGLVPATATNGTRAILSINDTVTGVPSQATFNITILPALPTSSSTTGSNPTSTGSSGSSSSNDSSSDSMDIRSRNIVLGVLFGLLLLALLLLLLFCCCRRRRRQKRELEELAALKRQRKQTRDSEDILGIGHQADEYHSTPRDDADASTIASGNEKPTLKDRLASRSGRKIGAGALLLGLLPFISRRRKNKSKIIDEDGQEERPTQWRSGLMAAFRRSLSSLGVLGRSGSESPNGKARGQGTKRPRSSFEGGGIRMLGGHHENASWISNQPTLAGTPIQHPIAVQRDNEGRVLNYDDEESASRLNDSQAPEEGSVLDFTNTRSSWETSSIFFSDRDRSSLGPSASWQGTQGSRPSQPALASIAESRHSFSNAPLPLLPEAARRVERDPYARNSGTTSDGRRLSASSIASTEGAGGTRYGRRLSFNRSDASLLSPSPTREQFGRPESREFSDAENDFSPYHQSLVQSGTGAGHGKLAAPPRSAAPSKRVVSIGSPALNRMTQQAPASATKAPPHLPQIRQKEYAFDPRDMPLAFVPLSHTFTEHGDDDDYRHVSTLTRGDLANEKLHVRDFTHARTFSKQDTPSPTNSRSPSIGVHIEHSDDHVDAPPRPLIKTPTLRLIVPSSPAAKR